MVRKGIYIILAVVLGTMGAAAQNLTRSPYSAFGVGDLQFNGFGQQQMMGRITQTIRSEDDYSIANPASYSALTFTTYQIGLKAIDARFSNNTQTQHTQTAALGYFSLAFPIKFKGGIGASFGLQPYSAIGYSSYTTKIDAQTGYTQTYQEGSGGLNRFYAGLGWRLHEKVSMGFNASYMFGQLITTDKVYFEPDSLYLDYREDRTRFIGGFNFDIGIQYHDSFKLKKKYDTKWGLNIGATYHMGSNLNASQQLYSRTIFRALGQDYRRDTVVFTDGRNGTISIPQGYSVGVGFGSGGRKNRWFFALEYFTQNWKKYTSYGNSENLSDLQSISAGASYQPKFADRSEDIHKKYFSYVTYRAGVRYANTQININNTQITEYGINFGLSLPVKPFRYVSFVHLGVEYNTRGDVKDNLIRENYYRFVLGLTLTDKWFFKYKYD